ncbi:MAG: T9SS type A sorting domain-containing protein, partial [Bacteroidales bacterium]|nr:T9SS type A sorting domain-containing protein [Bacteroidales bacterium]
IVIISIIGKVILDLNSDYNNMEIDLSMLEEGIYFISFYDIDGKVSTKKLIKE